ncbi:MAG TPA: ATP-dependent protease subunit HslV [Chloroflexota bacterium]|nr:ATP-dependent protease subunit HslV [Chloroflexota bacterium]
MTTIVAVRRDGQVAMAGDGQVTLGETIMKHSAVKLRPMYNGRVLAGFAGSVADALALLDRFENHLERAGGQVRKAAVDLAKEWRTDRYLRRLEAQLLLADPQTLLLVSGEGEVIEPDDNVLAVGSGGTYALSAAQALLRFTTMAAPDIAREAMNIAASICVYTNDTITLHCVDGRSAAPEGENSD